MRNVVMKNDEEDAFAFMGKTKFGGDMKIKKKKWREFFGFGREIDVFIRWIKCDNRRLRFERVQSMCFLVNQ